MFVSTKTFLSFNVSPGMTIKVNFVNHFVRCYTNVYMYMCISTNIMLVAFCKMLHQRVMYMCISTNIMLVAMLHQRVYVHVYQYQHHVGRILYDVTPTCICTCVSVPTSCWSQDVTPTCTCTCVSYQHHVGRILYDVTPTCICTCVSVPTSCWSHFVRCCVHVYQYQHQRCFMLVACL